jgi:hypothetical protein
MHNKKLFTFIGVLLCILSLTSSAVRAENVSVTIGVGDTTMIVRGYTSPLATVTIMEGNSVIGSTTVGGTGFYSQLFTAQSPGLHNIRVLARDRGSHLTDTVEIQANVQEHFLTTVELFLPPSIGLATAEIILPEPFPIHGETIPEGHLSIAVDGGSPIEIIADSNGLYSHQLSTVGLSPGLHQFYIVARDSNGAQSYPSAARVFTVLSPAANTPGFTSAPVPARPAPPTITSPRTGDVIDGTEVIVRGTAEPGTQIGLWDRGQPVGSAFADRDGRWSIKLQLTHFAYELAARACRGGLCSSFSSPPMTFLRQTPLSEIFRVELARYLFQGKAGEPLTLNMTLRAGRVPYRIEIDWGDGRKDTLTTGEAATLLSHTYGGEGQFNGTVSITDSDGKVATTTFSANITAAPEGPLGYVVFLVLIPVLLLAALFAWRYYRLRRDRRKDVRP